MHGFSVQFPIDTFVGGLKRDVRKEVLCFEPKTLSEAKKFALVHEVKLNDQRKSSFKNTPQSTDQCSDATKKRKLPPGAKPHTMEEQNKRREAGLCSIVKKSIIEVMYARTQLAYLCSHQKKRTLRMIQLQKRKTF